MIAVNWWLVGIAFVLGALLTTAWTLRRVAVDLPEDDGDAQPRRMSAGTKILLGIPEDAEDTDDSDGAAPPKG